jgi:hypothetical protein
MNDVNMPPTHPLRWYIASRRLAALSRRRRPGGATALVALLGLFSLAGCVDEQSTVEVRPSSFWQGMFDPVAGSPGSDLPRVTGQVAAIVQSGITRVGFGLDGVDRPIRWGIFNGSCASPGALLLQPNSYPLIPEGAEEPEAALPTRLEDDGGYQVTLTVDEELEQVIACADLLRVEDP